MELIYRGYQEPQIECNYPLSRTSGGILHTLVH